MSRSGNSDPRRKISRETVAKYRKVDPVVFEPISQDFSPRSRTALDTDLSPYSGEWSETQAAHLIKRTLFGVRKSELDYFSGLTMNQAVDEIVVPSVFPGPPINNYEIPDSGIFDPDVTSGNTWVEAPYNGEIEGPRIQSLKGWMVDNILKQETTIQQKMTLFWHNLLVTQFFEVFVAKASYKYYKMLYDNAFGNFKELIKKLTLDPAMLFFLNGTFNNKEAPDENYARELQELFCIGKGPNAGFTEGDVQEAAKVLTGWVISAENFESHGELNSVFYDPWHDTSNKQFSSFYGNRVITGRGGSAGMEETDELLDMIFENNETALYLSRRLYNFFVYHKIDEATEANVIAPMAEIFRANDYEILPVLRALFKSEHFYDAANIGAVIKNPADHLLGLWRTLEIDTSDLDIHDSLLKNVSLIWSMTELGMEFGDPPSVAGWQAYYQEPTYDKFWINTDTVTKRAVRQDSLIFPTWGHWVHQDLQINADLLAFIETLNNPGNPNDLIDECSLLFHGIQLSEEVKTGFKSILLSGQSDDFYWTDAWALYQLNKSNEENRGIVENRLVQFFQPFLQLGEFQLM